jgi:hypothetical protein
MASQNPYHPLLNFISELKRCDAADLTSASLLMVYVGIDLMALLSVPAGRTEQTRADFIAWADRYMQGHEDQPYQYTGRDLYGARCAALHAFAARSKFHRENPDAKYYSYTDGGRHFFVDPAIDQRLVIIGVKSLVNDFIHAANSFLKDVKRDCDLRARVEQRLPLVYSVMPMPEPRASGPAECR